MRGLSLFWLSVKRRPLATLFGLPLEYLTFFAAVLFGIFLLLTRAPLAAIDRASGSRLRERFIELIARISPG